jgi:hypothetical protein
MMVTPPPRIYKFSDGTQIAVEQEDELFALIRQAAAIYAATDDFDIRQRADAEDLLRAVASLVIKSMGPEPPTPESIIKTAAQFAARSASEAFSKKRGEDVDRIAAHCARLLRAKNFKVPEPNERWLKQVLAILEDDWKIDADDHDPKLLDTPPNPAWITHHKDALWAALVKVQ